MSVQRLIMVFNRLMHASLTWQQASMGAKSSDTFDHSIAHDHDALCMSDTLSPLSKICPIIASGRTRLR